jgi:uncharacterized protein with von Willebrand factor type A (vWA) domain
MGLMDRVKKLFDRTERRMTDLSSSVVTHDRVDDSYLEDFRDKAPKFNQVFENSPNVPQGDPPTKCPNCGTDEPDWQIDGAEVTCAKCQHQVAMPEAPWSLWADLASDAFRAYFTYDEPKPMPDHQIKPSHELHRRIMSRIINSDEFMDTRPTTRMNEFEAAFATMGLTQSLGESLKTGVLSEHARRSEQMRQQEQSLEDLERKLEALREAFEQGTLTPEQEQEMADLAAQHAQAGQDLDTQVSAQQSAGMGMAVADAVDDAVAQAKEDAEAMMAMPGVGGGPGTRIAPDKMFALAEMWRKNHVLRKVAELMGRLERDMRFKRANRVVGGFEEVVDVELGDTINLALPHELAKLRHPLLRLDFMRRFHEKSIAQYELRGNEPEGRGPVVVLVDGSGSMGGDRNVWARAVSLALVNIAHKERRDAACIEFGSAHEQHAWFFPGRQALDPEHIIDFTSHFFGGGTDIGPAVAHGAKIMEQVPEFNKADLVIITDGEDYYGEDDQQLKDRLNGRGVRIHGVGIGGTYGYLSKMAETQVHVSDLSLSGANEATDQLATAIT